MTRNGDARLLLPVDAIDDLYASPIGKLAAVLTQVEETATFTPRSGVFEGLFKAMSEDVDLEYALIDGTIVQVHQKATGSKGGLELRPSGARAAG